MKSPSICSTLLVLFLAACGGPYTCGARGINLCGPPPPVPALTLRASVGGSTPAIVSSPYALNLPNVGDVGLVTAYEGTAQKAFSLVPDADCANVVTISPGTQAMQQAVTSVKNGGRCTATAQTADGRATTLAIVALPPP